jgi:NAD(P)-dependent dehydrogenase (short-subunit alcohol dehydrogenase family)
MKFQGKKIVIIGGSSGIGLATAKAAIAEGAEVVIASRSEEKLRKAKESIPGKVATFSVDARNEESIKTLLEKIGSFDHLATPGSEGVRGPFLQLDPQAARLAFESKFWGQFYAARYAVPRLRQGGSITFMAGSYSQRPKLGAFVMTSINSAIEGLGRGLAVELSPIRVNVVSPGVVDTPMYLRLGEEQRKTMYQQVAASLPVKKVGQAEDIAAAFLFLMGNSYATGTTLYVDGGSMVS